MFEAIQTKSIVMGKLHMFEAIQMQSINVYSVTKCASYMNVWLILVKTKDRSQLHYRNYTGIVRLPPPVVGRSVTISSVRGGGGDGGGGPAVVVGGSVRHVS